MKGEPRLWQLWCRAAPSKQRQRAVEQSESRSLEVLFSAAAVVDDDDDFVAFCEANRAYFDRVNLASHSVKLSRLSFC